MTFAEGGWLRVVAAAARRESMASFSRHAAKTGHSASEYGRREALTLSRVGHSGQLLFGNFLFLADLRHDF